MVFVLSALRKALVLGILLGIASPVFSQAGESWGELRYIYEDGAPVIARERYSFSRNLISCRIREEQIDRNERCWGLSTPEPFGNIDLFEPEKAARLKEISDQIGPEGRFRRQAELILESGGYTGADLDAAMTAYFHAWNTGMDWANVLQVRMNDRHIFYVAFYSQHKGERDVPVDAALVPLPGAMMPEPRGRDVIAEDSMSPAEKFLAAGEYAKCAQQALFDAGFDPKGVDGAPGPGARAALETWAQANGLPMPPFTRDFAPQICHVLTARPAMPDAPRQVVDATVWPIWSGNVFYNESIADVSFAMGANGPLQISAMNFRDGLRFGNQDNRDMDLPWRPTGGVLLDGRDGRDSVGNGSQTPFARDMLRLIDAMSAETGKRSLEQMSGRIDHLRHALGADIEPRQPYEEIIWSIVDHVDGRDIVAADFSLGADRSNRRIVIFMANDRDGDDDQLLYAAVPIAAPPQAIAGGFPAVDAGTYVSGFSNVDCSDGLPASRSTSVVRHDGFEAFPVRLCLLPDISLDIVAWAKTNDAGDRLTVSMTTLDGSGFPVSGSSYDEPTGSNFYEASLDVDGTAVTCKIEKPQGAIAFNGEAICN